MKTYLAAIMLLLVAVPAFANDAAFGGSGANLMPLKNKDVAMVHEHIVMQAEGEADAWKVTVTFTFENTSDKPVELTMGFPFNVNNDEGDINPPKGKSAGPNDPLVWDFSTTVRGKRVKAKRVAMERNEELGLWYDFGYVWPVKFKAKEQIKVVNSYRVGFTVTSMGTSHGDYILKTGGLWKGGKIGRSEIEVHGPTGHAPCWTENMGPVATPTGAVRTTNPDHTVTYKWDLKDFKPTQDLSVCFVDLKAFRSMEFYGMDATDLTKLTDAQLRILRNKEFALHGYVFKTKAMADHFAKEPWYVPNPKYDDANVTKEERRFVARVRAEERRRAKPKPPAKTN